MTAVLIYDNSLSVPADISNLLGVNKFSDIYYRKRLLNKWISDICSEADIKFVEITGEAQNDADKIRQLGHINPQKLAVLYIPSYLAFGCDEKDAALFLKKISFSRSSIAVTNNNAHANAEILLATVVGVNAKELLLSIESGRRATQYLYDSIDNFKPLNSDVELIDLRDPLRFTDYLTSNFDVRFFNSVQPIDNFTLIKYSSDAKKLERECKYYELLPPELKMFFIQTYDFRLEPAGASYKMERLFVPDMALQWIHGSMDEFNFERFIDKVLHFIKLRPVKVVEASRAKEIHDEAFFEKVVDRLDALKKLPEYPRLELYIKAKFGCVEDLYQRYYNLYDKFGKKKYSKELRIGHGDLCFSNILYSKTTGIMRFIDARGASNEDDLYVSPYYDIAKLSHSICGNYDYINHGLCTLQLDKNLDINLTLDSEPPAWAKEIFYRKLKNIGYEPNLIRLFEVSLFLSMVPLHIDSPKKVISFLINANQILNEIENRL